MSKNYTKSKPQKQPRAESSQSKLKMKKPPEIQQNDPGKTVTQPRPKRSPKQLKNVDKNPEYYPEKVKRTKPVKKIIMKPKSTLKVIGGIRKRKLENPVRGSHLTMDSNSDWEADRAIQEAELAWNSDEDLLEILTCPSPVWWEDPPDDQYSEDPIPIKTRLNSNKSKSNCSGQNKETINLKINIDRNNKKFIEKRSKLENILGNIKTKVCNSEADVITSEEEPLIFNDDLAKDFENIKIPIAGEDAVRSAVPRSLPPLKRRPAKNSPQDSISDRNITFLDDSDMKATEDVTAVINDRCQSDGVMREIESNLDEFLDDSLVTIYKIMSNDRKHNRMENNNKANKINEYYKKRKNSKILKKKNTSALTKKCVYCKMDVKHIKNNSVCMICKNIIVDACKCQPLVSGLQYCSCSTTYAYKCKLCEYTTLVIGEMRKHLNVHESSKQAIKRSWKRFCIAVKR